MKSCVSVQMWSMAAWRWKIKTCLHTDRAEQQRPCCRRPDSTLMFLMPPDYLLSSTEWTTGVSSPSTAGVPSPSQHACWYPQGGSLGRRPSFIIRAAFYLTGQQAALKGTGTTPHCLHSSVCARARVYLRQCVWPHYNIAWQQISMFYSCKAKPASKASQIP